MSNTMFDLFDKLTSIPDDNIVEQKKHICNHSNVLFQKGSTLCGDCGIEVAQEGEDDDKHWEYYGIIDIKNSSDRCYIKKTKDKTIYQDLVNMNISDHIKDIANDIYIEVCKGKTHRGARRRSIVFASIFHSYKISNNPQSCESLIKIFKIKRKDALKGLKFINANAVKDSPIRTVYITPEDLIRGFLTKFQVSDDKRDEIIDIYNFVKDKSVILNRSRPQSVASGIIYYWIRLNDRHISIKDFTKKVDLSELTVSKMAKEIARICGKEGVV